MSAYTVNLSNRGLEAGNLLQIDKPELVPKASMNLPDWTRPQLLDVLVELVRRRKEGGALVDTGRPGSEGRLALFDARAKSPNILVRSFCD